MIALDDEHISGEHFIALWKCNNILQESITIKALNKQFN